MMYEETFLAWFLLMCVLLFLSSSKSTEDFLDWWVHSGHLRGR